MLSPHNKQDIVKPSPRSIFVGFCCLGNSFTEFGKEDEGMEQHQSTQMIGFLASHTPYSSWETCKAVIHIHTKSYNRGGGGLGAGEIRQF